MKYLVLFFMSIFFANISIAEEVPNIFPEYKKRCQDFIAPCSKNKQSKCLKTVCDRNLEMVLIQEFIKSHDLIGRKFSTPIELQDFIKDNIPLDLKKYRLNFIKMEKQEKSKMSHNTLAPDRLNYYSIMIYLTKEYEIIAIELN